MNRQGKNMKFESASIMFGAVNESDSLIQTVTEIAEKTDPGDIAEVLIAYPAERVTDECMAALERLKKMPLGIKLDIFPQVTPGMGFYSDTINRATGSHCIPFQSDMCMDIDVIARLIEETKKDDTTVCTTSRWLPGCKWTGYGKVKKIVNYAAQIFLRVLFGGGMTDYTNPVQAIPTELMKSIQWERNDFSRCLEMQVKPLRLGYKFREIPANCLERTDGESSNSIKQLVNYLLTAIKLRLIKKENILKPEYRGK